MMNLLLLKFSTALWIIRSRTINLASRTTVPRMSDFLSPARRRILQPVPRKLLDLAILKMSGSSSWVIKWSPQRKEIIFKSTTSKESHDKTLIITDCRHSWNFSNKGILEPERQPYIESNEGHIIMYFIPLESTLAALWDRATCCP